MRKRLKTLQRLLLKVRERLFKRLLRARFRYDVFISYPHLDARKYAINLKKQLSRLDYTCFIDEEEAPPGLSLSKTLERALKRSATFVLVGTERTLTRPYIGLELERFSQTKRTIIPVDVSKALSSDTHQILDTHPWKVIRDRELIWINETKEAFDKGIPSLRVAFGIDKQFKYTRRNVRVRAEVIGTAVIVLLVIFSAGFIIRGQAADLTRQMQVATEATNEATKQQNFAAEARVRAKEQLEIARKAEAFANEQNQIAGRAREEAERQQEIAKTATAVAERQQEIARKARADTEKQVERNEQLRYASDTGLVQRSYELSNFEFARELLNSYLPKPSPARTQKDRRGYEWYYMWHLLHSEPATLKGEGKSVYVSNVAYSPDGKMLAIPTQDTSIKIWDSNLQRVIGTLEGHTDLVWCVAFSPDGQTLASGSFDHTIKLWNVASGKVIGTLKGPNQRVASLAYSPDGKTLASGYSGDVVTIWDVASQRQLDTRSGSGSGEPDLAFAPTGNTLAIVLGGKLYTWKLLEETDPIEIDAIAQNEFGYKTSLAYSPNGKTLALGYINGSVKLIEAESPYREVVKFRGHSDFILSLAFTPDGKTLASCNNGGVIEFFDIASKKEIVALSRQRESIKSLTYSPDGHTLVSRTSNGTVKLWDISSLPGLITPAELTTITREELMVERVNVESQAFSEDGKLLAILSTYSVSRVRSLTDRKQSYISIWETSPRRRVAKFSIAGIFASVALSRDGKLLALGGKDIGSVEEVEPSQSNKPPVPVPPGFVKLWDVTKQQEIATLKGHTKQVNAVAISPDGTLLASGSADGTVKFWDVASRTELVTLKGHELPVRSVAFSPNGKLLASGGEDLTVKLWDVAARHEMFSLKGHTRQVNSLSFSPDGRLLASGSDDNSVKLWDVALHKEHASLKGHAGAVQCVAFSSDGKTLATGSADGTARLWNTAAQQELFIVNSGETAVTSVIFSSNGRWLSTGNRDGVKLTYAVAKDKVLASR